MKIANIGREFLHIFWTPLENPMKFSGKMRFKVILKATIKQGFTLSLEDTFFEKPQGGGSIWTPPLAVLGLRNLCGLVFGSNKLCVIQAPHRWFE